MQVVERDWGCLFDPNPIVRGVARLNNQTARARTDRTLVVYASFSTTREYFNFLPPLEENSSFIRRVLVMVRSICDQHAAASYGAHMSLSA